LIRWQIPLDAPELPSVSLDIFLEMSPSIAHKIAHRLPTVFPQALEEISLNVVFIVV